MNEQIKEMLNCIRVNLRHNKCFGGMKLDEEDCKLLLDYITNLQQNYNKLQDDYQEQYTYEYNLRKQLQQENEDYKSRCEKAIEEYTKTYRTIYYTMKYYRDSKQLEKCNVLFNDCIKKLDELDLQNILNGSDEK